MLHRFLAVVLCSCCFGDCLRANQAVTASHPPALPENAPAILDDIYSWRLDQAITEARQMQQQSPDQPLGYLLEVEALWWKTWCLSADFKYGMSMPRHREKLPADQHYLELTSNAYLLAETSLQHKETASMQIYAGLAEALASRLYSLRGENRAAARAGVRAREHFLRALALDPNAADAAFGLGLYDYYVDTLSTMARVLRFFMGIPGGSKAEGIRLLQTSNTIRKIPSSISPRAISTPSSAENLSRPPPTMPPPPLRIPTKTAKERLPCSCASRLTP